MNAVIVSLPRWQWRTVATDLSWLFKRLPVPLAGPGGRLEETHLICAHSSHSAVVRGDRLEVRWRKETAPEGFELWDTILDLNVPFRASDLERLWGAWGLPRPALSAEYPTIASFIGEAIVPAAPLIIAAAVTRECHETSFQGIACSVEMIEVEHTVQLQSFSIEHEDPSLMAELLHRLGLKGGDNINLLQSLRSALALPQLEAGTPTWPKRSNASFS